MLLSRTSSCTTRHGVARPKSIPPRMSEKKGKEIKETRFLIPTVHLKECCFFWSLDIYSMKNSSEIVARICRLDKVIRQQVT